jgi:probable phosphoglycerate mutase
MNPHVTADQRPRIWIIRHGQTQWSETGRHTGRTDVPLTEDGRLRARRLSTMLAGRPFARVISSPLSRAFETCRLAGYADQAELVDDLLEWDYGDYEGLKTSEIRQTEPGWSVWTGTVPGGETLAQVASRCDRVIEVSLEAAGDVLLVAHGHVLRVLAARWLGLTPQAGQLLALEPAAIGVLGYEHEYHVIRKWNEDGTLPA